MMVPVPHPWPDLSKVAHLSATGARREAEALLEVLMGVGRVLATDLPSGINSPEAFAAIRTRHMPGMVTKRWQTVTADAV